MRLHPFYVLGLLSLILFSCQDNRTFKPRLNLNVGDVFFQNMQIESVITEDYGTRKDISETNNHLVLILEVARKIKEGYEIDAYFNRIQIKAKTPEGYARVDSDHYYQGDVFSMMVRAITKKKFKLIVWEDGFVKKIDGLDEIFDSLLKKFPDVPLPAKLAVMDIIRDIYSSKVLKVNWEMLMFPYPAKPVKFGEQWIRKQAYEGFFPMEIENRFNLVDVDEHNMVIEGTGKTLELIDKKKLAEGIVDLKNLEGAFSYNATLHPKTGWIKKSEIEFNSSFSMATTNGYSDDTSHVNISLNRKIRITSR